MIIKYENSNGKTLDINNGKIRIVSIEGLSPSAVINTSSISGYNGATFISSQMPMRNIVLLLELMGDIEADRLLIYDIFKARQKGILYYETPSRSVKIECYTEKTPFTLTATSTEMQISLLCPQPYFEALNEVQAFVAQIVGLWEFEVELDNEKGFEFSEISQSLITNVVNDGEIDTGCTFVFYANGNCKNPKIENINTHEIIQVIADMIYGDTLTIDTRQGQKSIIFNRNGIKTNYFNYKISGSKFLQLNQGNNEFRYSADENERNLEITVYFTPKYCGV